MRESFEHDDNDFGLGAEEDARAVAIDHSGLTSAVVDELIGSAHGPPPVVLEPTGDRIIVDLVTVNAKESAIFMDATSEALPEYGRIRAVGPHVEHVDDRLKVGVVVMFSKFSGYALEGEHAMMLRTNDVAAVVRGGLVKPKRSVRPDENMAAPVLPPAPKKEGRSSELLGVNPAREIRQ